MMRRWFLLAAVLLLAFYIKESEAQSCLARCNGLASVGCPYRNANCATSFCTRCCLDNNCATPCAQITNTLAHCSQLCALAPGYSGLSVSGTSSCPSTSQCTNLGSCTQSYTCSCCGNNNTDTLIGTFNPYPAETCDIGSLNGDPGSCCNNNCQQNAWTWSQASQFYDGVCPNVDTNIPVSTWFPSSTINVATYTWNITMSKSGTGCNSIVLSGPNVVLQHNTNPVNCNVSLTVTNICNQKVTAWRVVNRTCLCGNGVLNSPEQCDLGANNGAAGSCCASDCTITSWTWTRAPTANSNCTGNVTIPPSSIFTNSSVNTSYITSAIIQKTGTNCNSIGLSGVNLVATPSIFGNIVCNVSYTGITSCGLNATTWILINRTGCSNCGNKVIESGEQCDLGGSNNSATSCCGTTCQLNTWTWTQAPTANSNCTGNVTITPNAIFPSSSVNTSYITSASITTSGANCNMVGLSGLNLVVTPSIFGNIVCNVSYTAVTACGNNATASILINRTGCSNCGNSIKESGEQCDLGGSNNSNTNSCCSATCQLVPLTWTQASTYFDFVCPTSNILIPISTWFNNSSVNLTTFNYNATATFSGTNCNELSLNYPNINVTHDTHPISCNVTVSITTACGQTATASRLVVRNCTNCGNGVIEGAEQCDTGANNGLATSCCTAFCTLVSAGTQCRASQGVCDITESCDGVNGPCPADTFYPSTTICHNATGPCDIQLNCTGTSAPCPPPQVEPNGFQCNTSSNQCTVNVTCNGILTTCPNNNAASGSSCDLDNNLCTIDQCDGNGHCFYTGSNVSYDDGKFCNGLEGCNHTTGLIIPGTPPNCTSANSCLTGSCNDVLNQCVYTQNASFSGPCGFNNVGTCRLGNLTCDGSGPSPNVTCVGAILPLPAEICGNGLDDNCNGLVDEGCNPIACNVTTNCSALLGVGTNITLSQCEIVDCIGGNCTIAGAPFGTTCDDGLACTINDVCQGGNSAVCAGTPIICNDNNTCTLDTCIEPLGVCNFDGTAFVNQPCVSADLCCLSASCTNQGQCFCAHDIPCPPTGNQCTLATCQPNTGNCTIANIAGLCNDGLACTVNDQCVNGTCVGIQTTSCDDFLSCTNDVCQEPTGNCIHTIVGGTCLIGGVCYTNNTVNPSDPCTVCDPSRSTIAWSYTQLQNVSCNDGLLCTINDVCNTNTQTCTGTPIDCSADTDGCNVGTCNPTTGTCFPQPVADGTSCSDGLFCTVNDKCANGACTNVQPRDCSGVANQCNFGVCNETLDSCVQSPVPNNTTCVLTPNVCNGVESCQGGSCVHGAPLVCPTGDQCLSYTCDSVEGCLPNYLTGSPCDDNNVCTIGDQCGPNDVCLPGNTFLDCDDSNPCTNDFCDAITGCYHTPVANCTYCVCDCDCSPKTCQQAACVSNMCTWTDLPIGTSCSDGNVCNGLETCNGLGTCIDGSPLICDDGNQCTDNLCNTSVGCYYVPNASLPCNDNNPCTINHHCAANGTCVSDPFVCPPATQCSDYTCINNGGSPLCLETIFTGNACNDNNLCTTNDLCLPNGNCAGTPVSCPAPNQCQVSVSCVGGNCIYVNQTAGFPCDNGDLCFTNVCDGLGSCVNGAPLVTCVAPDACHLAGTCVPQTGLCSTVVAPDGTSCDDANPCTQTDTCASGSCVGSNPVTCAFSGDQCNNPGVCNPLTGNCTITPHPDFTICNDNNVCTQVDVCLGGVCTGTLPLDCTNPNTCITAVCDPTQGCLSSFNNNSCNANDLCVTNTNCFQGQCLPSTGTPVNCNTGAPCNQFSCSPTGGCFTTPVANCSDCSEAADCPYLPCMRAVCDVNHTCSYVTDDSAIVGCVDNQYCNGIEYCSDGVCIHNLPPNCDDGNVCTLDACDYTLQTCTHTPNIGQLCEAIDQCATVSHCDANLRCVPSSFVQCPPPLQCQIGLGCLDTTGVCNYVNAPDGYGCNDGNPCTLSDTCRGGQCIGSNALVCPPPDQCHQVGTCNILNGTCSYLRKPNGSPCDDNNFCTANDVCINGICSPGSASPCQALPPTDQCQEVVCDSVTRTCSIASVADGTACTTGLATGPCTNYDSCVEGQCVRTYKTGTVCRLADDSGCDMPEYCGTDDACPPDTKQPDGIECKDNLFCFNSQCEAGVCTPTIPFDCTIFNTECEHFTCNEAQKTCLGQPVLDNTPCAVSCDTGDPCVEFQFCKAGVCVPQYASSTRACDDGNNCTCGDHCSGTDDICVTGYLCPNNMAPNCFPSTLPCNNTTVVIYNVTNTTCEPYDETSDISFILAFIFGGLALIFFITLWLSTHSKLQKLDKPPTPVSAGIGFNTFPQYAFSNDALSATPPMIAANMNHRSGSTRQPMRYWPFKTHHS